MADEKKTTTVDEVEETLACVAFAEEGEPCPSCGKSASPAATKGESLLETIEDDLACTAFSDQNEVCPICHGKKE